MNNGQIRDLCINLLHAETEDAVIDLLKASNFWDDPALWRYYGDVENNWGQSGNQQSLAEAALVEKIVNSVDARLINECLERGIDPKGPDAPKSIRQAVARFFEGGTGNNLATGGYIEEWDDPKIREVAQGITLCGTGQRPILNLTITDCGEGQTPRKIPDTILSLSRSNKNYIPFVQGQFNQGGTGALRFCGEFHNLQLVVSRRNPKILGPDPYDDDHLWGFTVVRRERGSGGRRNSAYTYLAPVGVGDAHPERKGSILSFSSPTLKLYPDKDSPYGREAAYGTTIKLFDYRYLGERSNIIRGRSILSRLDLLLPEIALPIRLYEFRSDKSGKFLKAGSRETTLTGLRRRLANTKNLEDGFPITIPFSPQGEQLSAVVYAFRPAGTIAVEDDDDTDSDTSIGTDGDGGVKKKLGGVKRYRKREGVIFVRNGQTQGSLPKDFFGRESLKLKTIADDLLVFVDCDRLDDLVREDLFMPSRDRLTENQFREELVDGLEQALRTSEKLKQLRNRRQQEQMAARVKDDKPFADVLKQLIRSSPNLTALLQLGHRITAPFNTTPSGSVPEKPFKGEFFPTFFKLKGVEYGKLLQRECQLDSRMHLKFETDARDDYFERRIEGGKLSFTWTDAGGIEKPLSSVGPNLNHGIASLLVTLPEECEVGDTLRFHAVVEDTRNTFEMEISALVRPPAAPRTGGEKRDRKDPDKKPGKDREIPQELSTPVMVPVYRDQWNDQRPIFDDMTAMRVGIEYDEDENEVYVFKVNMDNMALLNEIKHRRLLDAPARNQFMFGNVLVGLSMLLEDRSRKGHDESQSSKIEERIHEATRGLAPFMLALTSLGLEDLSDAEESDGLDAVVSAG